MPKSPVPEEIRQPYIEEGLKLRKEGKSQPDLEYNGETYFLDNKGKNHGGWRLRHRGSHSAQGSKRRAQQRDAVPTLEDYIDSYGPDKGPERYEQYKEDMKRIHATRGGDQDIDHMNSLASGGIEHPLNFRRQNSSRNRSEGARVLTPDQKNSLMLADNVKDQITVQGPKTTPLQRQSILKGVFNVARREALGVMQDGYDLFMQGQSGSTLDQALNTIPDTSETDLGRHTGKALTSILHKARNEFTYFGNRLMEGDPMSRGL